VRRALYVFAICALAAGAALPAAAAPRAATPDELLAQSVAAAKSASSVRVIAIGIPNGGAKLGFDLHLVAGKGGAGTITMGKTRIHLVRTGRVAYFRAGPAFWRQYGGEAAAQLFAGRWVKMPSSTPGFQSLTQLTDISKFFTGLTGSHGALKFGGTKTVGRQQAVAIIDTSTSGGTLWVAASGTPYPLELTPPSGPGVVRFVQWNTPMRVATPRSFIDLSKLKKK
jgi:hypothetical protein